MIQKREEVISGNITFVLEDSEGNEVYTLEREGKCKELIEFVIEESGTYYLTEKAEDFKGKYEITWEDDTE